MICDFFYLRNENDFIPDLLNVKWLRFLVPRDKVYAVILNDAVEPFTSSLEFRLPPNRMKELYAFYKVPYGRFFPIEDARNLYRALIFAGFRISQQYESELAEKEIQTYFPHLQ